MRGCVFISYKRDDSAGYTLALYNKLCEAFGKDTVFMDVDAIEPGVDFVEVIENAVGSCDALIALMGPGWVVSTEPLAGDPGGPADFVRLEIASALTRNVRVIPVLVSGRKMPTADELPEELLPLLRRNAVELSTTRFNADVDRLIETLRKIIRFDQGGPTPELAGGDPTPSAPLAVAAASGSARSAEEVPPQSEPDDQAMVMTRLDMPMPARLERRLPAERAETIELARLGYLLGRLSACDVKLHSPTASRQHARITARDGKWYLQPLPGKVVILDGTSVAEEVALRHHMRLQLGGDEFVFIEERAERQTAAPLPSVGRARLLYAVAALGALAAIVWMALLR